MAVLTLDHVNIATDKLAETLAFFVDVLGLTEGPRPPFSFPGHWLYAGGKDMVHLVGSGDAKQTPRDVALSHFALRIDDYEGAVARLEEHGLAYRAIGVPGRPTMQIFFQDPNGVTIELNYPGRESGG